MAIELSNLNEVIKGMAKLDKVVDTEVIKEVRENMRATMRKYIPLVKKISPKDTGELIKSIKLKSRSRRGVSKVSIQWGVPYAGPLNFRKTTRKKIVGALGVTLVRESERKNSIERYASDFWDKKKEELEQQAIEDIKKGFKDILGKHGIEVR